ncbi:SbcC/MukB-like Walker B domain-containing protein, partial [Jatrophihabitans sp.]|uniref:SbcC/MukB-like Walker B domain-containing protein n=1 Tax=Jatrophihabitans sp. TaxID=1932789 RepID=UPI0030C68756|nr:hypothetical protein [Jatrophihabitans sp.]
VAVATATRDAAQGRALVEAATAGFADLAAARAAVLPARQSDELRALVRQWGSIAAARHGAVTAQEFAGLDPAEAEMLQTDTTSQASLLQAALAEAEAAARRLAVAAERAQAAQLRFVAARAEADAVAGEHEALDVATAPVVHLARLAKGMSGNRRVNLTTYVLRQWFEQVVRAANARLTGMSSGRYELVRVDEGTTKAERTGLTLQVLDKHTGEQRSTRSLSGGETFYTSLALALGLADVVRAEAGGVELDTLFIDEGFGSLDAETLDQVMEVIDELRNRGRTVGIVSHVAELKHRIAERIEVRRLPDGSSTLRVVA